MAEKSKYYKHPKFGITYGDEIRTPVGRFVWPSLVTPKEPPPPQAGQEPGKPRYEVSLLLKKGVKEVEAFLKELKTMTAEMLPIFNDKRPAKISFDKIINDGDEADLEKYPYYEGHYVLVGRNSKQPEIFNKKREKVEASELIGGLNGVLLITPLITAHGVSYKLSAAQIVSDDGTRFGSFSRDVRSKLVDWDTGGVPEEDKVSMNDVPEATPKAKGKTAALNLL